MNRANRYLLKHFSELFSSLFFILFFITSVVFFIKITTLTAVIQMNFLELNVVCLSSPSNAHLHLTRHFFYRIVYYVV